jgi:hypothetical protein
VPHRRSSPHDKLPRRLISEHAFDKLRRIDCTLAEFIEALETAELIDEAMVSCDSTKVLLLVRAWLRPLHVVVIRDGRRREERIITVYEPARGQWDPEYRERRR